MLDQNAIRPPWISKANLFSKPEARCKLTLDGCTRLVSIALWEGYCYLKIEELEGVWGITQPYDQTDFVEFVKKQIRAGEVGRVWCFKHSFSNFDSVTRKYTAIHREEPLTTIGLMAIVRFDNSALVRNLEKPLLVSTPAFDNNDRRHRKGLPATKDHRPSIWHPKRALVGKKQIGDATRTLIYQPIPQAELQFGKTGSISKLVELLSSLFICTSVSYTWNKRRGYYTFHWPAERKDLSLSRALESRIDLKYLLEILWDYHHYDVGSWVPTGYNYSPSISNLRYEWQRAGDSILLLIPRNSAPTAHQKIEASLIVYKWFKNKISKAELDELLPENL